jgi:hypothetical protein
MTKKITEISAAGAGGVQGTVKPVIGEDDIEDDEKLQRVSTDAPVQESLRDTLKKALLVGLAYGGIETADNVHKNYTDVENAREMRKADSSRNNAIEGGGWSDLSGDRSAKGVVRKARSNAKQAIKKPSQTRKAISGMDDFCGDECPWDPGAETTVHRAVRKAKHASERPIYDPEKEYLNEQEAIEESLRDTLKKAFLVSLTSGAIAGGASLGHSNDIKGDTRTAGSGVGGAIAAAKAKTKNSQDAATRIVPKTLAKMIKENLNKEFSISVFKDMIETFGLPKTQAVSLFCRALENMMKEKHAELNTLGEGQVSAEAIEYLSKYPNYFSKHFGYSISDESDDDSVVEYVLKDGNILRVHREDWEVEYVQR